MKKISIALLVAFLGFGFSNPESLRNRPSKNAVVPSGQICVKDIACTNLPYPNYVLHVTHIVGSGTAPTTLDIIINGVDTGANTSPGSNFSVPNANSTVTLKDGMSLYAGINLLHSCRSSGTCNP